MVSLDRRDPETSAALLEEAAVWRFLHDLFRGPSESQWAWLNEESVSQAWGLLATATGQGPSELPRPGNYAEYETTYLAAFEVGAPHPPCPLVESHWMRADPVPQILHEHVLFYRQFGLELKSAQGETADHLRHQLEFLAHLCTSEANADDNESAEQISRGRSDFLDRHARPWIAIAAEAADEILPDEWPAKWMALLAAWV